MTLLADLLATVFERRYSGAAPKNWDKRPLVELANVLVTTTGEASGLALAGQILGRFALLPDEEKLDFFRYLATEMNIDPEAVRSAVKDYENEPAKATYRAFMAAVEPKRQELIRRLNQVPGATRQLVRMRADLIRLGKDDPQLQALDLDFRHLFASWFNRGFLVLRPISWESPAHVLEKIIAYEAVHAIESWDDLRHRLEPADRRCFAFFHPAMPDEPLIFVEVALTRGVPGSIQSLLTENRSILSADAADTAVFYSISNCQTGLAGISFGSSLIKQVASDLSAELANLKTFVTLSPIPGLMQWLEAEGIEVSAEHPDAVRAQAAHYLLAAKNDRGMPLDPVARFHLGNGAVVQAVHARADLSEKGLRQSAGAMVNYLYELQKISENNERFAQTQEVLASAEVRALRSAAAKLPA